MLPDLSAYDLELVRLPAFKDNYLYLLVKHSSGEALAFDPGDVRVVQGYLEAHDLTLTHIFLTHHHWDHVDGVEALVKAYDPVVVGYIHDAHRLPAVNLLVEEGEEVTFGNQLAEVLFLPGHTLGHIAYYFRELNLLFSGDVLFSLGCGRLFEGTAGQMLTSLNKIKTLPDDTLICCSHEYTEANAAFAHSIEPHSDALKDKIHEIKRLREGEAPTVPMFLGDEKALNPFLRAQVRSVQEGVDMLGEKEVDVFAELRRRKDHFKG